MPCCTKRMKDAGGAASFPGCWADERRCIAAGPRPLSGSAAGGRYGGGLRPLPYPAGAGKGAVGWAAAGPAVLADCHSDPVPLVPERLGRTGKAVRSGLLCGGRSPLFWDNQPLAAASGLPGSRSDGRTFGHFDLSAGGGEGNSKKNQKNCKKHLPFRNEMV